MSMSNNPKTKGKTRFGGAAATVLALLAAGCAQQGYPSGGPKDTQPPVVAECEPPNGSARFGGDEFVIRCDENIQTKETETNVLVSPPLKHKPHYTVRGRELRVKLKDTLRPNATYTFLFSGAIVDFHEGNPLPSFEYTFATGEALDSMAICGSVTDAFTHEARKKPVSVMLYAADSAADDSVVVRAIPDYITMCAKDGSFCFAHLRPGRYKVVAMEDEDRNKRLNGSEAVAFADTLVEAAAPPRPGDSAARFDTLRLAMSKDSTVRQRVTKSDFVRPGLAQIVTAAPLGAGWSLRLLGARDSAFAPITHLCPKGDTVRVWLPLGADSVALRIADSSTFADTLKICRRTGAKAHAAAASFFKTPAKSHPYWDTLWIAFENPIARCGDSVGVLSLADSSRSRAALVADSSRLRAHIDMALRPGGKYQFVLPGGLLRDIYDRPSDSLAFETACTKAEDYGAIKLTLLDSRPAARRLLEMTDEKGGVVRQQRLPADTAVHLEFPHLAAGKYTFRLIIDSDSSGDWTPGSYWLHRQPERVIYFGKTLDLHANWDMEEKWQF